MRSAVESLKEETLADINRIQCFLINTRMGYSLAREKVKEAHEQPPDDPRWAVALEIVANFEFYEHRLLPKTALLHAVGSFESFVFEFLRLALESTPRFLPESITIRRDDLVRSRTRAQILQRVVQEFLEDLHNRPVREWFVFLTDRLRLTSVEGTDVDRLCEIFAAREQLLKSNPVVDDDYVRRTGESGRWKRGATAEATVSDFNEACRVIQSLVNQICDETIARLRPRSGDAAAGETDAADARVG